MLRDEDVNLETYLSQNFKKGYSEILSPDVHFYTHILIFF